MQRKLAILLIALVLPLVCASLLFAGCGSSDSGDYERKVSELNEAAAGILEEMSHHLAEGEPETEEERVEAVVAALEETVEALNEVVSEMAGVKVPAGMEDFHHALLGSYHAQVAYCEALIAALEPEGEPAEEELEHGEEAEEEAEGEENGEESEQTQEEEAPHEEEPTEGSGH